MGKGRRRKKEGKTLIRWTWQLARHTSNEVIAGNRNTGSKGAFGSDRAWRAWEWEKGG